MEFVYATCKCTALAANKTDETDGVVSEKMVAAANAYRCNKPLVGKENIGSLRKLLEHEHRYLDHDEEDHEDTTEHKAATRLTIDRLAALVLDFDLRYVLKRMEHEHNEGDGRKGRD